MRRHASRTQNVVAAVLTVLFLGSCGSLEQPSTPDGGHLAENTVDNAGGSVSGAEGTSLQIPKGALGQATNFTITKVANATLSGAQPIGDT